jgi:hypothetical protein
MKKYILRWGEFRPVSNTRNKKVKKRLFTTEAKRTLRMHRGREVKIPTLGYAKDGAPTSNFNGKIVIQGTCHARGWT